MDDTFNSLFEMPYKPLGKKVSPELVRTFNSLFEMHIVYSDYSAAVKVYTFNSLFEMQNTG